MDRRFALPIVLSASAHLALLFGVPSSPSKPKPAAPDFIIDRIPFELTPPEPEPVPLATASNNPPPESTDEFRPTAAPEPLPTLTVDSPFKIDVPKLDTRPMRDLDVVPMAPPRMGTGPGTGVGAGNVIPGEFLDAPPRTRVQPAPLFPHEARRQGMMGEVLVEFVVDERGHVMDPRVVSSSHRVFEDNTLRAVAKWRFEPGRRDGRIVRFRMVVPVVFSLNE